MTGFVYAIQIGDDGPIKIGQSRSPEKRLASLQGASPYSLRIAHRIPNERGLERGIHHVLAAHRMRGEWFTNHPEVFAALALAASGGMAALFPMSAPVEYAEIPEIKITCRPRSPRLANWIRDSGNTASALAGKCGCSVSTITRLARGEIDPSHDMMKRIWINTGGAVSPNDLLGIAA